MSYMGFGKKWRNMIYECLSSLKLLVLINGSSSNEFSVLRGLRQGDPISPFLFDIAVEGFLVLFYRTFMENIFRGLQFVLGLFLSHLQYTDDTLIFIPIDIDHLLQVKNFLRWFALSLGLHINFYKSFIIGVNVEDHLCLSLAKNILCKSDSFPCNYLGTLLGANPSRIST
jgi:mannosylglycoprotein endo-beta-mannosidase